MKTTVRTLLSGLIVLTVAAHAGRAAEVRPLEFVRALQERGYHDMAIDYLNLLKERQAKGTEEMAKDLGEIWDLEMARSLRGAVNRAYNVKLAEEMSAKAQVHLDKFLKEHAQHPEADTARVQFGAFVMDGALRNLRAANSLPDKEVEQKQKLLQAARTAMEDARPRFKQASDKLLARLNSLPQPRNSKDQVAKERARVKNAYFGALFQSGLLEYYVVQTYEKRDDPSAKASLKAAGDMFNYIWQFRRLDDTGRVDVIGLQSHMWEGKTKEEAGDLMTAIDIYEEALANDAGPDDRTMTKEDRARQKQLEPLFAQVQQNRLALIAKTKPQEYYQEARDWIDTYGKKWYVYDGFQGVVFDLASAMLAEAEKGAGKDADKLKKEATALLREGVKTPSSYQQKMYGLLGGGGKDGAQAITAKPDEMKTFDEAVLVGDACAKQEKWPEAATFYRKALELAETLKGKDAPKRVEAAHNQLANVEYRAIHALFDAKKFDEVLPRAEQVLKEEPNATMAPAIGLLSVWAQYNLVPLAADAEAKKAAQAKFEERAQWLITTWPGKAEADDVRMIFAQMALGRGDAAKAVEILSAVNPQSDRYPVALFYIGQLHWQSYVRARKPLLETRQEPDEATKKQMDADRKAASEKVADAVARFKKIAAPDKPAPPQQREAEVQLVEIRLDEGNAKEAVTLLEPMIEAVKAAKAPKLDLMTMRVFMAAVRAYLTLNDIKKAGEVGMILVDLGEDQAQVNTVLVDFARNLDKERKKAEADRITANSKGDAAGIQEAQGRLTSMHAMMGTLLKKLAARKEHSPAGMMFIAEMCTAIDLGADAAVIYQALLEKADGGDAAAVKYATRARAALIGLKRKEGNFKDAVEQATKLAEANPRALEPKMELARVYQAWAEQDPAQYKEAVTQWTVIRNMLEPLKRKREYQPVYYEVIYNSSYCLFQQAKKQVDTKKAEAVKSATLGGQLLTSSLVLSPKLSGPEMVAKYQALLKEVKDFIEKHKG